MCTVEGRDVLFNLKQNCCQKQRKTPLGLRATGSAGPALLWLITSSHLHCERNNNNNNNNNNNKSNNNNNNKDDDDDDDDDDDSNNNNNNNNNNDYCLTYSRICYQGSALPI